MLSLAACDNSDYELDNLIPDKYKRVVCIQNEQRTDLELFDVGFELDTEITVLRSGGDPSLEAATSLVAMTQDELSEFNPEYKLLDPSLYTIASKINFAPNERYKIVSLAFSSEAIKEMKENCNDGTYYAALKLQQEGETTVDTDKYYILRRIVVKDATIDFGLSNGVVNMNPEKSSFTVSLPFNNTAFDIAWDLEVENVFNDTEESKELGNQLDAKYARKGMPLEAFATTDAAMAPGVNSLTYSISMPEGTPYGVYWLKVKLSNPTLNEAPIATTTGEDVEAVIRYEYMPDVTVSGLLTALNGSATALDRTGWVYCPESCQNGNPASYTLDGDLGNFWENRWGDGYGPTSLPFNAVLDMGSKQKINILEPWRRSGGYVTDTKTIEIYAAETVDYSNRESIQYGDLTYIGTVEFGNTSNTRQGQLFALDPVETRYLIMRFTGSNRNGSCISLAEIGAWTTEE